MNWPYLGVAALLPLVLALGATMAVGALQALRLTRLGEASRPAFTRLLKTMAITFPLAFLAATLWDGRATWRGLLGVAMHHRVDQRAMGLLRAHGEGFLTKNPAKAADWFQQAAEGGDAEGQLLLARALLKGQGLPRDPDGALRWARTAAEQGQPDAMVFVGDRLRTTDDATAKTWYQRALPIYQRRAQTWDPEACLAYGLLCFDGKGTEPDQREGLAWMYVSRRIGLDPFKTILIQLDEAKLSKPQRDEAAQRAVAILKALPHRGTGKG
jgi:TPR repeat protein